MFCMSSHEELCQGSIVGNDGLVGILKYDIFDTKLLGACSFLGWFVGVLAYQQEEIECDARCLGLMLESPWSTR
jgi:hypothetical protein